MKENKFKLSAPPSAVTYSNASKLGFALQLMAASALHQTYPIAYVKRIIEPALRHGFIKFYFDEDGKAAGYAVWASVAPDVERLFLERGRWDMHESEWNEGDTVWIIDLVVTHGHLRSILHDLKESVFAQLGVLRYFRVKNNKIHIRELARRNEGKSLIFFRSH